MKIIGFAKYDHEKTRFWFDCLNHSYKIIENIYYDSKGNVLDSDSANTGRDWNSCPPDSISDELCKSVCTYADLNNIY